MLLRHRFRLLSCLLPFMDRICELSPKLSLALLLGMTSSTTGPQCTAELPDQTARHSRSDCEHLASFVQHIDACLTTRMNQLQAARQTKVVAPELADRQQRYLLRLSSSSNRLSTLQLSQQLS